MNKLGIEQTRDPFIDMTASSEYEKASKGFAHPGKGRLNNIKDAWLQSGIGNHVLPSLTGFEWTI